MKKETGERQSRNTKNRMYEKAAIGGLLNSKDQFRWRPPTYGLSSQKGTAIRVILFKDPAVTIRKFP